jgi:predicted tellurium resistance membrane protein TerC
MLLGTIFDFSVFATGEAWIALATLTLLEIVLGVDNIIFISILSNKLPDNEAEKARKSGLVLALGFRIALLLGITYIIKFDNVLFTVFDHGISGKDLILMVGGLFLLAKSTTEIHHKMEVPGEEEDEKPKKKLSMSSVILQVIAMDIIFSFDSILTAVGLAESVLIMIIAVVISLGVMIAFAGKIAGFIKKHPSLEILALSFLILIGFMLVVEGLDVHVPKGYIYFALFFSLMIELLNMRLRKKTSNPLELNKRVKEDE